MTNEIEGFSADHLKRQIDLARQAETATPKPMVTVDGNLNFSAEASDLIARVESDPGAAAALLTIAAEKIRHGAPLPVPMREWFAGALQAAAAQPVHLRAKSLTDELGLSARNRRPKGSWVEIGHAFEELMQCENRSQSSTKREIAVQFSVDEKTALTYWRKYVDAKEAHDGIE